MTVKIDYNAADRNVFIRGDGSGRNITIGQASGTKDTIAVNGTNVTLTTAGALTLASALTATNGSLSGTLSVGSTSSFVGQITATGGMSVGGAARINSPTSSSSTENQAFGPTSLNAITGGFGNTAVGSRAGQNLTSGNSNVFYGYRAGDGVVTADACVAIGNLSLGAADVDNQVAIGNQAMRYSEGQNNIAIGSGALAGNASTPHTGQFNIAIGTNALAICQGVTWNNVAIGSQSLSSLVEATGNTCIGKDTGRLMTTGVNNTLIGNAAGDNITTGSSNIMIGPSVEPDTATTTGQLKINYAGGSAVPILSGSMDVAAGGNRVGVNTLTHTHQLNVLTENGDNCYNLLLDQDDAGEGFVVFEGSTSAGTATPVTSWTTGNTIQGFVKVQINGVVRWIPFYDNPTS